MLKQCSVCSRRSTSQPRNHHSHKHFQCTTFWVNDTCVIVRRRTGLSSGEYGAVNSRVAPVARTAVWKSALSWIRALSKTSVSPGRRC
jgi:hypothetical protein